MINLSRFANKPPPACFCGECQDNSYKCSGCSRIVPWCFGAGDNLYLYCDDCAATLYKAGIYEKLSPSQEADFQAKLPTS